MSEPKGPLTPEQMDERQRQRQAEYDAMQKPASNGVPVEVPFPVPIPASQLRLAPPDRAWIWNGVLRRGEVTLMPALWKSGKTTLLAHMLREMALGGEFLGRDLLPSRVLYVAEESEHRWAMRRDQVGITDNSHFLIRPFQTKPSIHLWEKFLDHVGSLVKAECYDLVVFDTLANLWPLKDENDASAVQACLMPMHAMIADQAALQLVHHTRKSDGVEATASRGSGALTGFVDTIIEFRRFAPADRQDRRRVLTGYGRHDETPSELVIELTDAGYVARGEREQVRQRDVGDVIASMLPPSEPGLTIDQIHERWPDGPPPLRQRLLAALGAGVEAGRWRRKGEGRKGSPYLHWMPRTDSVSVSPLIRGNTETESDQPGKEDVLPWPDDM